jgi:hypothetical protein
MTCIRRAAVRLAGLLAIAGLATFGGARSAFAMFPGGPTGTGNPAPAVMAAGSGVPGWQVTLIAIASALVAATVAIHVDRTMIRREPTTSTEVFELD